MFWFSFYFNTLKLLCYFLSQISSALTNKDFFFGNVRQCNIFILQNFIVFSTFFFTHFINLQQLLIIYYYYFYVKLKPNEPNFLFSSYPNKPMYKTLKSITLESAADAQLHGKPTHVSIIASDFGIGSPRL